mmetsp:Transcript_8352/g.30868  ORF Transcript_8352/g.30868 Transcript_8352/m.30868 type:complete len:216 (+) Transcript_8352:2555-3202(+)
MLHLVPSLHFPQCLESECHSPLVKFVCNVICVNIQCSVWLQQIQRGIHKAGECFVALHERMQRLASLMDKIVPNVPGPRVQSIHRQNRHCLRGMFVEMRQYVVLDGLHHFRSQLTSMQMFGQFLCSAVLQEFGKQRAISEVGLMKLLGEIDHDFSAIVNEVFGKVERILLGIVGFFFYISEFFDFLNELVRCGTFHWVRWELIGEAKMLWWYKWV